MSDQTTDPGQARAALRDGLRRVRAHYDQLERGRSASLRRCRTADEVALEGIYWRIGSELARDRRDLAHVVLLFPLVEHATNDNFSFGRFLRQRLALKADDNEGSPAMMRFRRLLASRDRTELDHRMRSMLRLAAGGASERAARVDWGVLGLDLLWFFAESDAVRRRWAQDFYAPIKDVQPSTLDASATTNLNL